MVTDSRLPTIPYVEREEPARRPPPIAATGIWGWMRANLFKSTFDTILTLVAGTLILAAISGLLTWALTAANWLVIIRNIRLFMAGSFPIELLWRVNLAALLAAFAVGYSIYAYMRPRRNVLVFLIGLLLFTLLAPPIITMLTPPVNQYLVAGSAEVQSGTVTEAPVETVAFTGRAGETIAIRYAPESLNDTALTLSAGFTDRAAAGLFNAARAGLATEAQINAIEARLAGDTLTAAQRTALEEERASLSVPPTVTETYAVNTQAVTLQVLDGATGDVLTQGELVPLDPTATYPPDFQEPLFAYVLPADGWYLLRKTVNKDADGVALLEAEGIYPVIERNLTGGTVYARVTDDFTVTESRPQIDGDDVAYIALTDYQYQGTRPLGDYLRLYAAPVLDLLARALVPLTIAGVVGYWASAGVARLLPRPHRPVDRKWAARQQVVWVWAVFFIALSILIYGIPNLTPLGLGLLIAAFVWVGWCYFVGVNLNQPWGRPLLGLIFLLGIVQFALMQNVTAEFIEGIGSRISALVSGRGDGGLLNALLGIIIWLIIGVLAARQGVANRERFAGRRGVQAVIIAGILWLVLLVITVLIANALAGQPGVNARNLLPVVDTRRWGGLLLTMVLTIVSLVASFPLGILLALGRRSSLPAIKWACILVIELVRAVPLITILFLAQLLVPLVSPGFANVENVFRAMIALTIFSAAYLAENVRGGLQSVPYGQEEAARALGLNTARVILLITLPQALRAVIPALVGQAIAVFQNTSLVALVGLTDLTGIAKGVVAQAEFIGTQTEAYIFIAVIYFIFSYVMSYISRRIEASGSGAARRI